MYPRFEYLTMELCHTDLFSYICKERISDDRLLKYMFRQLCSGVQALHNQTGHCHLDLKLENILVGRDNQLKLCDFGFA